MRRALLVALAVVGIDRTGALGLGNYLGSDAMGTSGIPTPAIPTLGPLGLWC